MSQTVQAGCHSVSESYKQFYIIMVMSVGLCSLANPLDNFPNNGDMVTKLGLELVLGKGFVEF